MMCMITPLRGFNVTSGSGVLLHVGGENKVHINVRDKRMCDCVTL